MNEFIFVLGLFGGLLFFYLFMSFYFVFKALDKLQETVDCLASEHLDSEAMKEVQKKYGSKDFDLTLKKLRHPVLFENEEHLIEDSQKGDENELYGQDQSNAYCK